MCFDLSLQAALTRTMALVLGLGCLIADQALADVRQLEAIQTVDGGPEPAGAIPWVRATFDDRGVFGGAVLVTIEAPNLSGTEHVTGLYLNVDPQFDPKKLSPGPPLEKQGEFETPTGSYGANAFQPYGAGKYDIYLEFASSGNPESFFGVGDSLSFLIGSAFGLRVTPASFDFPSSGGGANGPFYMAARIEGIGPNNESAWIATPEPSSALLAAIAFLGVALVARWRATGPNLLALGLLLLLPAAAFADVRQLEAIQTIDGGPEPAGAIPWVRATFDDKGVGPLKGPVFLTVEALNLVGTEHVTGLYLNLNPQFDPKGIFPGPVEKTGEFETPSISFGADVFQAIGDGKYDIYFEFASSGDSASFFGLGDLFTVGFGSPAGLPITAASFDFPSDGGGENGPFYMAVRIDGIGPNNESAWIATPEPSTAILSVIAFLGVALVTRLSAAGPKLLALGLLLMLPSAAFADVRQLEAIQTIDGGPEPAGAIPWVRATFDDKGLGGGGGPVTLILEPLNLAGDEHVTGLYLNLDPQFNPQELSLFPIEKHGSFDSPLVSFGADAFQPAGGGKYDIYFEFASFGNQGAFFGVGDSFALRIGSSFGLPISAASFDFPSTSGGTSGPFYMAARIEGIGPNNESAWIATPEPSSAILALMAVLGAAMLGRGRAAGAKLLVLSLLLLLPAPASADVRHLEAIQTFDGGPELAGDIPWVRAAFDDKGKSGVVTLTFEPLNLTGNEHVTGLYLNLNPNFEASQLSPFPIEKHGSFTTPILSLHSEGFQANDSGKYDIYFEFASSGDPASSFGVGDSFSLRFGSVFALPITAASFDFPSIGGANGPFYMAARIEGIGPNNESAWIATPEPSSAMLALIALGGGLIAARWSPTRTKVFVLGLLCLLPSMALADVRQLEALQTIDGGPEPVGAIPWVRATFDDGGDAGGVNLTFEPLNLTGSEYVAALYLNLDPAFDASKLAFFPIQKHGSFDSPVISPGNDAFQAGNGGKYDLYFDFADTGGVPSLFSPGDWFSLEIGSLVALPITAASFDFPSTGGASGPFYMAARIEGIGPNNNSAWIATPEPSALALSLAALFALAAFRRSMPLRRSGKLRPSGLCSLPRHSRPGRVGPSGS